MPTIFGFQTMDLAEAINGLIEEAKVRIVWWGLCIFAVSFFLTHTSESMWMNIPASVLLFSALHIFFDNVEFHWKVQRPRSPTYLSHLGKKQLSLNDSRLSTKIPPPTWKSGIGSTVVEAALSDFVDKLIQDFIIDLVCTYITPDKEFPDQIHALIMDAIGEISRRVKEINLVDLLTRDIVHLVGDHIDLFRKNQAAIGVDVMLTLSSEERDERLKYHLLNSKELHPALVSPESEYKVLRRLMSGLLALVLRRQEAHCPVIRSIAQEILTCLVMQPILKLACPGYINELIEELLHIIKDMDIIGMGGDQCTSAATHHCGNSVADVFGSNNHTNSNDHSRVNQRNDETLAKLHHQGGTSLQCNTFQQETSQIRHADWARVLEAATQRRTEVLMPENLENMWTKGRDYKKKENTNLKASFLDSPKKGSSADRSLPDGNLAKETSASKHGEYADPEGKSFLQRVQSSGSDPLLNVGSTNGAESSQDLDKESPFEGELRVDEAKGTKVFASNESKSRRKRPDSATFLGILSSKGEPIISGSQSHGFERQSEGFRGKSASDTVIRKEGQLVPKLRCRVMGAYFEKLDSKTFAVYSIAVTDAENNTWFVKRRYRNFDTLHRELKDTPKYRLHLPPKRIFSSSTEDSFVHERCILLDKYLQELMSIPNVTEHHEIWDFLSISSKNYSLGKSSTIRTLAVNVDGAVDDIVRQFEGVSDGLTRKIVVPLSSHTCGGSSTSTDNNFWNDDGMDKIKPRQNTAETVLSSNYEDFQSSGKCDRENITRELKHDNGRHSDIELNLNGSTPHHDEESGNCDLNIKHDLISEARVGNETAATNFTLIPDNLGEVPPEWTPPNVTVPILKLVDKVFQLQKRGWLRRQVFWISKQILQLAMEDAIDDFLLRQIHWLRSEDTVAQGIRWVQDILWPGGTFFLSLQTQTEKGGCGIDQKSLHTIGDFIGSNISKRGSASFEQQLEAARRASDIKKLLFDGAPTALVSLIGQKQYRRCARDIYYFSQSTICVKQLSFAILELVLTSIFPEMKNLIVNVHAHMRVHKPV
ncbi:uncharacterized protein LOC129286073 [Prosopis cineraria]|uniref:uncharacterized protein LOC129286073 n=1 Tax=Prosopis cineraria TaxID=364024 RepID=UPI002410026F|nr:uncharacterized protein LOC129286073 [Prosopis cineraria]